MNEDEYVEKRELSRRETDRRYDEMLDIINELSYKKSIKPSHISMTFSQLITTVIAALSIIGSVVGIWVALNNQLTVLTTAMNDTAAKLVEIQTTRKADWTNMTESVSDLSTKLNTMELNIQELQINNKIKH